MIWNASTGLSREGHLKILLSNYLHNVCLWKEVLFLISFPDLQSTNIMKMKYSCSAYCSQDLNSQLNNQIYVFEFVYFKTR